MKLTKAIEIQTKYLPINRWPPNDTLRAAMQLGNEAMQRIQVGRNNPGTHWNDRLPGETKD